MQVVRVGVGGMEVRVGGMLGVKVWVLGSARMAAVIGIVDVAWGVWFTNGAGESCGTVNVGVILCCGRATDPQDDRRISPTQRKKRLLCTLAVYHKIHLVYKILSPCEYAYACFPIHSFTGKIAGYLPWRNK
jgi:hypothetical protein